jgi:hypothetical protein
MPVRISPPELENEAIRAFDHYRFLLPGCIGRRGEAFGVRRVFATFRRRPVAAECG